MGRKEFCVVEYGAGTGMLCHDILCYIKNNNEFFSQFRYYIIEKSPAMCQREKAYLHEKVSWHNSIQEISTVTGCILSNEVVDNFSVHQVVMQDQLMEVFVDYKNGFVELLCPAEKNLTDYFAELNVNLPRNFRTEINLEAIRWIKEIAAALKKGYVLTIDYGYPSAELYRHYRSNGTLVCYHQHNVSDQPYQKYR